MRRLTRTSEAERRHAFVELLSRADATDVQRRHRITLEGCPHRHGQLPRLAAAYVQAKLLERRECDALGAALPTGVAAPAADAVATIRNVITWWRCAVRQVADSATEDMGSTTGAM